MSQADFYPGEDESGIVIHKPDSSWVGNALVFVDEEGEDRARIDENGAAGFQALHIAPGTNTEGTYPGAWGYGIHLDPRADVTGYILDNPPTTDPDTGAALSATKDYLACRNRRAAGNPVELRISKDRYLVSKKNAAPTIGDLAVGEFTTWFDPGAGVFKVTGKKTDGTLITKSL